MDVTCMDLGRRAYGPVLELQQRLVDGVAKGTLPPHLLLVEHDPPVITLGRRADPAHVLADPNRLEDRGIEVHEITRGGDVTYHGPGQIVAYPILPLNRLGRSLHGYLRGLEEAVIRLLAGYGLMAGRIAGLTGVWVDQAKIAAIGVAARKWVTWHGMALNVTTDLREFEMIVPCGIADRGVTSLAALGVTATLGQVKAALATNLADALDFRLAAMSGPPAWIEDVLAQPMSRAAKQPQEHPARSVS